MRSLGVKEGLEGRFVSGFESGFIFVDECLLLLGRGGLEQRSEGAKEDEGDERLSFQSGVMRGVWWSNFH